MEASFLVWAAENGVTDVPSGLTNSYNDSVKKKYSSSNDSSLLGQNLKVTNFLDGTGRGLSAARQIRRGETVLEAPMRVLLSVRSANGDVILGPILRKHKELTSLQVLCIHLLHEVSKGETSFWCHYIKNLPREYTILATFSALESLSFQAGKASSLYSSVSASLLSDWSNSKLILTELKLEKKFKSLKAWIWAHSTVSSRTLYVPWDSAGALCPVADLLNYCPPGTQGTQNGAQDSNPASDLSSSPSSNHEMTDGGFSEADGVYRIFARQDYSPGDQVFLCYGSYTNLELVEHYGFVLDSNPCDSVEIPLPFVDELSSSQRQDRRWAHQAKKTPSGEQRLAERAALLTELGVAMSDSDVHLDFEGLPSFSLLSALRYFAMPAHLRKECKPVVLAGSMVSQASEVAAYDWLLAKCESLLLSFPTSASEDKWLLEYMEVHCMEGVQCTEGTRYGPEKVSVDSVMAALGEHTRISRSEVENWSVRVRLAVQWRLGQKKMLLRCLKHCRKVLEEL